MSDADLRKTARAIALKAYAPYSRFYVGAAVLFDDGDVFCGANVENKSYGLTICAERAAIFAGISAGKRKIAAVAICCLTADCLPCGACLQVLAEFATADTRILIGNNGVYLLKDLLPKPFELA